MFNFFKFVPVNKFVKQTNEVVSYANNNTYKVLCYSNEVQIYYKDWEFITLAIDNIKFCCIPDDSTYLVIISQNADENKIIIMLYNISTQLNRISAILLNNSIVESRYKISALSALKLSDTQLHIAIGLDNGNVYFCRNMFNMDINNDSFMVINVCSKEIKGIKFSNNKQKYVKMFICSDTGVFCYTISNNWNIYETKTVLDDMTSLVHCSTLKPTIAFEEGQYFVVARDDALYCYTSEGRGPCYALNGHKHAVEWLGKRLIILLNDKDNSRKQSFNKCNFHLVIIDILNKITVLKKEFHEELYILPIKDQSKCLIFLKSGVILDLVEHELKYKLSHLLKKNLYDVALKFLEESKVNSDTISNVYVHYGDYLLQRGDISKATEIYSKTIGIISPFQIIKKLMSFRYNEYLVDYLSKLVDTKYKIPEYIDLLSNCWHRINLPRNAIRIFAIEENDYSQLYLGNKDINRYEELRLIINSMQKHQNIPINFFNCLESADIENIFSDFGYHLIKKYPNELKDLVNYLLSNRFINDSFFQRIVIALSLMNKLYAIDFIQNMITNYQQDSIYNIWTELILQMWAKGNINLSCAIEFFKVHQSKMNVDNVFILCRNHNFWPGIRIMLEKGSMEVISSYCLVKSFEIFPEYSNTILFENSVKENRLWIQTLKSQKINNHYSEKLFIDIIKNILKEDPFCILSIIEGFENKRNILLSHLNDFLINDNFFLHFKDDEDNKDITLLEAQLNQMENTLKNFINRPIEFRNRSCDICKQIIKQPSLYFLCQHAYHNECIRQYSEIVVCIICENTKKIIPIEHLKYSNNLYEACNTSSNTILLGISNKLRNCIMNYKNTGFIKGDLYENRLEVFDKNMEANPFKIKKKMTSNTFFEYDANLNPFNDCKESK